MDSILLIVGILLLVVGFAIRYIINRRRFYRRGPGGLQHYDNYEKAVTTSCLERLGKLIAFALILFGLLLVAMHFTNKQMEEKAKREIIDGNNI